MNNIKQKLGVRVFFYYLVNKTIFGLVFLILYVIVASSKSSLVSKMASFSSIKQTVIFFDYLVLILLIMAVVFILGALFLSWIKYISCNFTLGENALSIRRGILSIKEVSIPYRHIQNINIEQSFNYRIIGVSKLIILTAGNDDVTKASRAESVFEVIDSKIALKIKEFILQKTSVQNINEKVINS